MSKKKMQDFMRKVQRYAEEADLPPGERFRRAIERERDRARREAERKQRAKKRALARIGLTQAEWDEKEREFIRKFYGAGE